MEVVKKGFFINSLVKPFLFGYEKGYRVTRFYIYRHIKKVLSGLVRFNPKGKILSICHSSRLCKLFDLEKSEVVEANYPEYNCLSLPFEDDFFGFVLSDQVLEHVEGSPQQLVDETCRIFKKGGIAINTVPFMYPIHASPSDYWRYLPEGLTNVI